MSMVNRPEKDTVTRPGLWGAVEEGPGVLAAALSPFQGPSKRCLPQQWPTGWTVMGTPTGGKDLIPQWLSCQPLTPHYHQHILQPMGDNVGANVQPRRAS